MRERFNRAVLKTAVVFLATVSSNLTPSAIYFERVVNGESRGLDMNNWSVYILECSDGTYYTGITNDIEKRIKAHNSKSGARYTSRRIPVKCVYHREGYTQSEARKEEIILKDWSRKKKEKLIKGIISRLRSRQGRGRIAA